MKAVAVFLLLLSTVFAAGNTNRILNGTQTPKGIFDFVPALTLLFETERGIYTSTCSSTIISPRHILTAAHCFLNNHRLDTTIIDSYTMELVRLHGTFIDYRPKEPYYSGSMRLKNFAVAPKIYVHPSYYMAFDFLNDIAIIEFPEGTDFKIPPILLASDYQEKDGDFAIAAGYGVYKIYKDPITSEKVSEVPSELQNVTVPVYTPEKCPYFHEIPEGIPTIICSENAPYRIGQGDYGGPLFVARNGTYYQLGIASFMGSNNAFYTRLSSQCDWIAEVTKNEAKCVPLPYQENAATFFPPTYEKESDAPESSTIASSSKATKSIATKSPEYYHPLKHEENGAADSFNIDFLLFILACFIVSL